MNIADLTVGLKLDMGTLMSDLTKGISKADGQTVDVGVAVDTSSVTSAVDKAVAQAQSSVDTVDVPVSVDSGGLSDSVDRAVANVKPKAVEVPVEMDERSADNALEKVDTLGIRASMAAGGIGDFAGALEANGVISEKMAGSVQTASATIMGVAGVADLAIVAMETLKGLNIANTIETVKNTAAQVAQKAVQVTGTAVTWAMTTAQAALNAVMAANPIGLIVLALAGLVAAVVIAYKNSETFRNIVQAAWEAVQAAIKAVVDWFINTAWPIVKQVIGAIVAGFLKYKDIVVAVWTAVYNGVKKVVEWLKDTAWPAIKGVIDNIKSGFDTMKNFVVGLWDGLKSALNTAWVWMRDNVFAKFTAIVDGLKGGFKTATEGIKTLWDGLKKILGVPVNFVINTIWNDGLRKVINLIPFVDDVAEAKAISFAKGGVLPGFTPGRDVHKFYSPTGGALALSGGEAIMRPEWVKSVGGAAGIKKINDNARKGIYDGFASGGIWRPTKSGSYSGGIHGSPPAVDVGLPVGTPVHAGHAGTITASYDIPGHESRVPSGGLGYRSYGRVIKLSGDGFSTLYAHLSERMAKAGQHVSGGTLIGKSGNTGHSFGPHMHFGATGTSPRSFGSGSTSYSGAGAGVQAGSGSSDTSENDSIIDKVRKAFHLIPALAGKFREMASNASPAFQMIKDSLKSGANAAINGINSKYPWFIPGALKLPTFDGGGVMPHMGLGVNTSGAPEAVLTNVQWRSLDRLASAAQFGGGVGRSGPAVYISELKVSSPTDVESLMQRAEFYARSGRI